MIAWLQSPLNRCSFIRQGLKELIMYSQKHLLVSPCCNIDLDHVHSSSADLYKNKASILTLDSLEVIVD